MKINQSMLTIGSGGNVLVDTTNFTPQDRSTLKQNRSKSSSSSGKKKKPSREKRRDGIYVDDVTPQKEEQGVASIACQTVCSTIPEEEDGFDIRPEEWESIAEDRRKILSLLLDTNLELTEEVERLEEILKEAKALTSLAQNLADEDSTDMVNNTEKKIESFFSNNEHLNGNMNKFGNENKVPSSSGTSSRHSSKGKRSSKKAKRKSENCENALLFESSQIYADGTPCVSSSVKRTKEVQVQTDDHKNQPITAEMLTCESDSVSPVYWEIHAGKLSLAIEETERENARLKTYIELLEEMSTEAKELALLIQSVAGEGERGPIVGESEIQPLVRESESI